MDELEEEQRNNSNSSYNDNNMDNDNRHKNKIKNLENFNIKKNEEFFDSKGNTHFTKIIKGKKHKTFKEVSIKFVNIK